MKFTAFFPGQGSQYMGMGKSVCLNSKAAEHIFDCASDITGQNVKQLCFDSDIKELSRTINSQIAILTCSLAVLESCREQGLEINSCAGFSLGEYTALAASGILSYEDTFRLVKKRGEVMQKAADNTDGCMAAVLGLSDDVVEKICSETEGTVLPVNYNCSGQLVIAGTSNAVNLASERCKASGARRVAPLAVSGAFHTPLMSDAAAELRQFAQNLQFSQPVIPIYTNTTGELLSANNMPEHLEKHMVSPVKWKTLVENVVKDGHCSAIEIGAGKTLTGFAKRISRQLSCTPIESMDSILSVAKGAEK